ncbi:MAG: BatD family protein, partial [Gammaproteobacteria bacterium]|nr:BatD family protein [Gammaproteobacteria bacterium]
MVIKRVIVFLLVLFLPVVVQAKVSAKVDRTTIEDGETFQLTLQYDDDEPDIEDLKKFFDVLGTSRSSKVSIINGSVNRVNEWLVTLAPRNIGQQVIPSIKFGNEATPPIQIKVIKPSVATAGQGADIFLEAKVDQPKAYVQSQIVFTIRLYRAVDIKEASLTEPAFDDAIVERMGDDVTFQTRRAGRLYNVTQRRYAIFAQQSGILEIPEMVFQGLVLQPMRSSPNMDPFNRFFQTQPTRRVRVRSEKLSVEVMPQPASYSGEHWLPAKRLILTESWSPEKPEFKVGEPVTRTLRLQATGLTGSQLPELKLFDAHGIKHYADQPAITTSVKDNNMLAVREEKFAIIPTQPGKLVLPEVRLSWWNTEFEREETLNIPPRIIDVAPAAVSSANAASPSTAQPEPSSEPEVSQKVEKIIKQVADPGLWPLATAAFALAWL